jgi:CRISPR-associated protein Cst2
MMKTIQGYVLIDVDVVALNNAGGDKSTNLENAVMTKKIRKEGREYPYVSGQAWRYWWRNELARSYKWEMSPVEREKKIAFTKANPAVYPDDDIFGYMRAAKAEMKDEKGEVVLDKKGNPVKEDVTLTRVSPLKNSALIAVAYNPIIQNWASMTRQDGDAVPYGIDEYCAVMKGMFSIDLESVGTFSMINRSGFMNINDSLKKEAKEKGAVEIDDPIAKDKTGNPMKLIRLPKDIREKRVKDTILALKTLSGGAKQSTNMADVTPKLIVLTQFHSGNHPFSHLAKEDHGKAVFSVEALKEILKDYQKQFCGKLFIGKRAGFMDELDEKLKSLVAENPLIEYGPVNEMIEKFVSTITVE